MMPAPIVIPPSQDWDGNDGPWSSFTLQVGTPAQDVRVFVSTAGYQTWVVLPQGCTASDPANCVNLRGGEFLTNQSTTWAPNNGSSKGLFELGIEDNLGYSGNGEFGYDTVTLGWQGSGGPSLQRQVIAGIATKDFYLGCFGINPRPSNFSSFDNPVPSYMTNLRTQLMIPSLSWAYTAGNRYRFNKVLGSLTLGGYDTSRFIPNDVSFAFNEEDIRDLTVNVETITMTANGANIPLLSTSIAALVDSTVPYIYLPLDVCNSFERAFGISWNESVQAYLINDTLHTSLAAQNANVTFTLSNSTIGHTVNITLPYAAFDLVAESPLTLEPTRYFPLMRAANDTQYTLGRSFLQEAYLIADYERRNFSVSQCAWNAESKQQIVAITSLSDQDAHPNQSVPRYHSLAKGAIAGAVIGGVVAVTALLLLYFYTLKLHHHRHRSQIPENTHEKDCTVFDPGEQELDAQDSHNRGHELDSQDQTRNELDAVGQARNELDAVGQARNELDAVDQARFELDAVNGAHHEPDDYGRMSPRHKLDAGTLAYELPTTEMSPSSTTPALA